MMRAQDIDQVIMEERTALGACQVEEMIERLVGHCGNVVPLTEGFSRLSGRG